MEVENEVISESGFLAQVMWMGVVCCMFHYLDTQEMPCPCPISVGPRIIALFVGYVIKLLPTWPRATPIICVSCNRNMQRKFLIYRIFKAQLRFCLNCFACFGQITVILLLPAICFIVFQTLLIRMERPWSLGPCHGLVPPLISMVILFVHA